MPFSSRKGNSKGHPNDRTRQDREQQVKIKTTMCVQMNHKGVPYCN